MAFGDRKGGLSVTANSITNPITATGSVAVSVGDLVFAVLAEQTNLTVTAVSDNLGNTYTAKAAGTDAGAITARAFYSRVSVAGTLTSVSATATASGDNVAFVADVFEGPFDASPLDANPANGTADLTSPFTCPATGTRAQASEVVLCFAARPTNAYTATSPNLKGGEALSQAVAAVTIGYQTVSTTTSVAPEFTGTNPTVQVLGTGSFKAAPPTTNGSATQATSTPTQTSTAQEVVAHSASQTTATPTQTATGDVDIAASASQTTAVPSQTATASAWENRAIVSWLEVSGAGAAVTNADASQTTALPTQTATAAVLVSAAAVQTTASPTQTATAAVLVSAQATQTTGVPSQAATATVHVSASAVQTTSAPTQTATGTIPTTDNRAIVSWLEVSGTSAAVNASASQTTALPAQTATGTVRVSAAANQTTALPAQTTATTVRVTASAAQTTALPSQTATATIVLAGLNAAASQTTALPVQTATETVRVSASVAQTTAPPSQTATAAIQAYKALSANQATALPSQTATAREIVNGAAIQVTPAVSQAASVVIQLRGAVVHVTGLPSQTATIQYGAFRRATTLRTRSEDYNVVSRPSASQVSRPASVSQVSRPASLG